MKHNFTFFVGILIMFVCLTGCRQPGNAPSFSHDIKGGPTPWSGIPDNDSPDHFNFAIISDLNSGERAGVFEVAVEQLNLLRPDFVLSVGDLVDGGTEDTVTLRQQYDDFDRRARKTKAPFFHLGGNHDLTNLVMRNYWEHRYGKRYYYFLYHDVLFLMMDSEDYSPERMQEIYVARAEAITLLDSGREEEAHKGAYFQMPERVTGYVGEEQSAYFEKVIADHPNVRWTFILMHKPVWQREGTGNLSGIEQALTNRKYTLINGHFHDYSYTDHNGHDYMILGTTGGGQNPNSENSFDHITWISMNEDGPSIATLRMDGILDKTAHVPLDTGQFCFQASRCK